MLSGRLSSLTGFCDTFRRPTRILPSLHHPLSWSDGFRAGRGTSLLGLCDWSDDLGDGSALDDIADRLDWHWFRSNLNLLLYPSSLPLCLPDQIPDFETCRVLNSSHSLVTELVGLFAPVADPVEQLGSVRLCVRVELIVSHSEFWEVLVLDFGQVVSQVVRRLRQEVWHGNQGEEGRGEPSYWECPSSCQNRSRQSSDQDVNQARGKRLVFGQDALDLA